MSVCLKTKKYSPQMSLKSLFDCPQYNYPVYLYHLLSSQCPSLHLYTPPPSLPALNSIDHMQAEGEEEKELELRLRRPRVKHCKEKLWSGASSCGSRGTPTEVRTMLAKAYKDPFCREFLFSYMLDYLIAASLKNTPGMQTDLIKN